MTKPKTFTLLQPDCEVRPIPGFERLYSASAGGRIWSHGTAGGARRHAGRWLRAWVTNGYLVVGLVNQRGDKSKYYVHRLVALAWLPNPDPVALPHINHKDGNPGNPHHTNLEWCDRTENLLHAYRTGLRRDPKTTKVVPHAIRMGHANRAISMSQAGEVRALCASGMKQKDAGARYGIGEHQVSNIVCGKTYRSETP